MTLTEALEQWVAEAERMNDGPATKVVVTHALDEALRAEQDLGDDPPAPTVANLPVVTSELAEHEQATVGGLAGDLGDIQGADRVCVYAGEGSSTREFPLGHDPAMPVFFVPVPPATLDTGEQLEMYNRLRWYGLGSQEALDGSVGAA